MRCDGLAELLRRLISMVIYLDPLVNNNNTVNMEACETFANDEFFHTPIEIVVVGCMYGPRRCFLNETMNLSCSALLRLSCLFLFEDCTMLQLVSMSWSDAIKMHDRDVF